MQKRNHPLFLKERYILTTYIRLKSTSTPLKLKKGTRTLQNPVNMEERPLHFTSPRKVLGIGGVPERHTGTCLVKKEVSELKT